jgi:hypothetical protein
MRDEPFSEEELAEMNISHAPFTDDEIDDLCPTRKSLVSMIQKALQSEARFLSTIAALKAQGECKCECTIEKNHKTFWGEMSWEIILNGSDSTMAESVLSPDNETVFRTYSEAKERLIQRLQNGKNEYADCIRIHRARNKESYQG